MEPHGKSSTMKPARPSYVLQKRKKSKIGGPAPEQKARSSKIPQPTFSPSPPPPSLRAKARQLADELEADVEKTGDDLDDAGQPFNRSDSNKSSRSMQSRIQMHAQSVRTTKHHGHAKQHRSASQSTNVMAGITVVTDEETGVISMRPNGRIDSSMSATTARSETSRRNTALKKASIQINHVLRTWVHWSFSFVLLGSCFIRVNAVSLFYLVMFVLLCVTSTARFVRLAKERASRNGVFFANGLEVHLKLVTACYGVAVAVCFVQVLLQLVVASYSDPYSAGLPDRSYEETVLRQIGFSRLNGSAWAVFRLIAPDILTAVLSRWVRAGILAGIGVIHDTAAAAAVETSSSGRTSDRQTPRRSATMKSWRISPGQSPDRDLASPSTHSFRRQASKGRSLPQLRVSRRSISATSSVSVKSVSKSNKRAGAHIFAEGDLRRRTFIGSLGMTGNLRGHFASVVLMGTIGSSYPCTLTAMYFVSFIVGSIQATLWRDHKDAQAQKYHDAAATVAAAAAENTARGDEAVEAAIPQSPHWDTWCSTHRLVHAWRAVYSAMLILGIYIVQFDVYQESGPDLTHLGLIEIFRTWKYREGVSSLDYVAIAKWSEVVFSMTLCIAFVFDLTNSDKNEPGAAVVSTGPIDSKGLFAMHRILAWANHESTNAWNAFAKTRWVVWTGIAVGVLVAVTFPSWVGFTILVWAFLPWEDAGLRPPQEWAFCRPARFRTTVLPPGNASSGRPHGTSSRTLTRLRDAAVVEGDTSKYFATLATHYELWCEWQSHQHSQLHPFRRAIFLYSTRFITAFFAVVLLILFVLAFPDRKDRNSPALLLSQNQNAPILGRLTGFNYDDRDTYINSLFLGCAYEIVLIAISQASVNNADTRGKQLWRKYRAQILMAPRTLKEPSTSPTEGPHREVPAPESLQHRFLKIVEFVVGHLYIFTFSIIYLTALLEIHLINTVYIIILFGCGILFTTGSLGKRSKVQDLDHTEPDPDDDSHDGSGYGDIGSLQAYFKTTLRIWSAIVIYTQLVIWLTYTWVLSSTTSDQTVTAKLFGLPDSGVPQTFLYLVPNIVIYYSASIQLIATRHEQDLRRRLFALRCENALRIHDLFTSGVWSTVLASCPIGLDNDNLVKALEEEALSAPGGVLSAPMTRPVLAPAGTPMASVHVGTLDPPPTPVDDDILVKALEEEALCAPGGVLSAPTTRPVLAPAGTPMASVHVDTMDPPPTSVAAQSVLHAEADLPKRPRAGKRRVAYVETDDAKTPAEPQVTLRKEVETETGSEEPLPAPNVDKESTTVAAALQRMVGLVASVWTHICVLVVLSLTLDGAQTMFNTGYLAAVFLAMTAYVARFEQSSAMILDAVTIYAALVVTLLYVFQFEGIYTRSYDGQVVNNPGTRLTEPLWNASMAVIPTDCRVGDATCFFIVDNRQNQLLFDVGLKVASRSDGGARTIYLLIVETVILVLFFMRMRIQQRGFFARRHSSATAEDNSLISDIRQSRVFRFFLSLCYFVAYDSALICSFASVSLDEEVNLLGLVTTVLVMFAVAFPQVHKPDARQWLAVLLMSWLTLSTVGRIICTMPSTLDSIIPEYQKSWIGINAKTVGLGKVVLEVVAMVLFVAATDADSAWLVYADSMLSRVLAQNDLLKPQKATPRQTLMGQTEASRGSEEHPWWRASAAAKPGAETLQSGDLGWTQDALAMESDKHATWVNLHISEANNVGDWMISAPRALLLRLGSETCMTVGLIVAFARLNAVGVIYATMVLTLVVLCIVKTKPTTWKQIRAKRNRVLTEKNVGRWVYIKSNSEVGRLRTVTRTGDKTLTVTYHVTVPTGIREVAESDENIELLPIVSDDDEGDTGIDPTMGPLTRNAAMHGPPKHRTSLKVSADEAGVTAADAVLPWFTYLLRFTTVLVVYQYAVALWFMPDTDSIDDYKYDAGREASRQDAVLKNWLFWDPVRPRTNSSGYVVEELSGSIKYEWNIQGAPHAWTQPSMLAYDFIFALLMHSYIRTLKMSKFREQNPHVVVHEVPENATWFWLHGTAMALLPWVVVLFALLAVLARTDVLLLVTFCAVLRILNGHNSKTHSVTSLFYPPPRGEASLSTTRGYFVGPREMLPTMPEASAEASATASQEDSVTIVDEAATSPTQPPSPGEGVVLTAEDLNGAPGTESSIYDAVGGDTVPVADLSDESASDVSSSGAYDESSEPLKGSREAVDNMEISRGVWRQLLFLVLFILYFRIFWTLPSRFVNWENEEGNGAAWLTVNLFGLRYGHGIRLLPMETGEEATPVWGSSGIGLEIVLFSLVLVQLYALSTSAMDAVCRDRHTKCVASRGAFMFTVFPATIEYMRNRRWAYDKGKRTAEMICGKVQRLKDEEEGKGSRSSSSSTRWNKGRMIDMAKWFSDPDNFEEANGAGIGLEFREFDADYAKMELEDIREHERRILRNERRKQANERRKQAHAKRHAATPATPDSIPDPFDGGLSPASVGGDELPKTVEAESTDDSSSNTNAPSQEASKMSRVRSGLASAAGGVTAFASNVKGAIRRHMVRKVLHTYVDGANSVGLIVDRLDALEDEQLLLCPVHGDRCAMQREAVDTPFAAPLGTCTSRIGNWKFGEVFLTYCFVSSEIPCVIMLGVCSVYNASLLSVVYAWSWLLVGMFWHPFPASSFWLALIYYTEAVLVFRYFCNLQIYGRGASDWTSPEYNPSLEAGRTCTEFDYSHGCNTFARVLGVVRQHADGPGYIARLVPEVVLLLCLCYHRSVLYRMGKWTVDPARLQEYTSRRRDTVARDKRFVVLEPLVEHLYRRNHSDTEVSNFGWLARPVPPNALEVARYAGLSEDDPFFEMRKRTIERIIREDLVTMELNLRKLDDLKHLETVFRDGPRIPLWVKHAANSRRLNDLLKSAESFNSNTDDYLAGKEPSDSTDVHAVRVREEYVGVILRQEFDLPNALKWSDLELFRLLSYHHPSSDGSLDFNVFLTIIRIAITGADSEHWEKDALEQEQNDHHGADDVYRALYDEIAALCVPDERLTHSNLRPSLSSVGLTMSADELVLFYDARFAREQADIPDTEVHYLFPKHSWSGLLNTFGMRAVQASVTSWLFNNGFEETTRWERIGGRWCLKKMMVQSGGGLEPDEIVDMHLRQAIGDDDIATDALEVVLRLVSVRVVDKLRLAAVPIRLSFSDGNSGVDDSLDPELKKSGPGRPNEEISFETFKGGLNALRKASPLRFCSSGLLADLYKRLYWDEAAILDVVKEVFFQQTLEALENYPNITHMVIPESTLRSLTVKHFRRFKKGEYFEKLLNDEKLHEFFAWYAADMAPKDPELSGRGVLSWIVHSDSIDYGANDVGDGINEDDVFFDGSTQEFLDVVAEEYEDECDDHTAPGEPRIPIVRVSTADDDDDGEDSFTALKGRTQSYADAMEKKAAQWEADVDLNMEDESTFGDEEVVVDGTPTKWQQIKTAWHHYSDWQELTQPHDLYVVELFTDVIMLLMFFPIWGTKAFLSAEQRFDSKLTQGGADSEASGSFVITYTELGLLLRQFTLIVLGRILFARRWTSIKIVMHFYRALELFIVTYFVLPLYTGLAFLQNPFVLWIFFFTMIYLFASGRQIRTGYPTHGYSMDMFTKSAMKIPMFYIWTVYRIIPFMVELKVMWDWVVSPTSLSLIEWFKLEDINAQLHKNRMADLNNTDWTGTNHWYMDGRNELGKPMPNIQKLIYAAIAFVLLVIIWLPLILIPVANANSEPHIPTTATIRVSLDWDRTDSGSGLEGFLSTPVVIYEAAADPIDLSEAPFTRLQSAMADFDTTGFASLYDQADLALFAFPSFSPRRWDISPTMKEELTCAIASNLTLGVTYEVHLSREKKSETSAESVRYRTKFDLALMDTETGTATSVRDDLLDMMDGTRQSVQFTRSFHNDTSLPFALLVGKGSAATEVTSSDLNFIQNQFFLSLYFQPNATDGSSGKYWWNVAQTLPAPSTGTGITSFCTEEVFCVPYATAVTPECGGKCPETAYSEMYSIFSNSSNAISTAMGTCATGEGALPEGYGNYLYDTGTSNTTASDEQQRNRRTYLITFNKRVAGSLFALLSSSSGSLGVLGLYISVVLVVGQFVRLFTQRISQRIIFEDMAQTTTLMNLVFSIFMAREAGRLRIEEELWRLLVRIYRRPRTLLDWTSLTLLKDYDSATLRFRQRLFCFDQIVDEDVEEYEKAGHA